MRDHRTIITERQDPGPGIVKTSFRSLYLITTSKQLQMKSIVCIFMSTSAILQVVNSMASFVVLNDNSVLRQKSEDLGSQGTIREGSTLVYLIFTWLPFQESNLNLNSKSHTS